MKAQSKAQLQQRVEELGRDCHAQSQALAALIEGEASNWFGREPYRLRVAYPKRAHGGVVIVESHGSLSTYFFEKWSRDELAHIGAIITGENTEHNRELQARRHAIEAAQKWVASQLERLPHL